MKGKVKIIIRLIHVVRKMVGQDLNGFVRLLMATGNVQKGPPTSVFFVRNGRECLNKKADDLWGESWQHEIWSGFSPFLFAILMASG